MIKKKTGTSISISNGSAGRGIFPFAHSKTPVDPDRWIGDYIHNRYGLPNDDAYQAWRILKDTVYTAAFRTHSVVTSVPTLNPARVIPYGNDDLARAWEALLTASDDLGAADTYRFDLVNLSRQVLSNHAADLHREVVDAYETKDLRALEEASSRFLQLIRELDELVATRHEFLLGRCLEDAKRWGMTNAERDRFEWNARRVLTLWGQGPAIDDYARKEWSGMLNGYYLKRWERFLDELARSLRQDKPFDNKAFQTKLRKWMTDWSDQHETYPTQPRGDSIQVTRRLWARYGRQLVSEGDHGKKK